MWLHLPKITMLGVALLLVAPGSSEGFIPDGLLPLFSFTIDELKFSSLTYSDEDYIIQNVKDKSEGVIGTGLVYRTEIGDNGVISGDTFATVILGDQVTSAEFNIAVNKMNTAITQRKFTIDLHATNTYTVLRQVETGVRNETVAPSVSPSASPTTSLPTLSPTARPTPPPTRRSGFSRVPDQSRPVSDILDDPQGGNLAVPVTLRPTFQPTASEAGIGGSFNNGAGTGDGSGSGDGPDPAVIGGVVAGIVVLLLFAGGMIYLSRPADTVDLMARARPNQQASTALSSAMGKSNRVFPDHTVAPPTMPVHPGGAVTADELLQIASSVSPTATTGPIPSASVELPPVRAPVSPTAPMVPAEDPFARPGNAGVKLKTDDPNRTGAAVGARLSEEQEVAGAEADRKMKAENAADMANLKKHSAEQRTMVESTGGAVDAKVANSGEIAIKGSCPNCGTVVTDRDERLLHDGKYWLKKCYDEKFGSR